MEYGRESIAIDCEISVLWRIWRRHILKNPYCIPSGKSAVIIRCRNDAKKLCERSIISAISDVLERKILKENWNCDEVTLDISEETLTAILDCLNGIADLDFSQLIPMYAAAKRFGIQELSDEIKGRFTLRVCEKFSRVKGILDKVSDSDVPYILDLISGLKISGIAAALLCQALLELKSLRGEGDGPAFETISGILSAATESDEFPAPSTECFLRGENGQLLRITGAPSDTYFSLSDDPRVVPADVTDNFVIMGDLCISIKDGDLEVRPLGIMFGDFDKRLILRVKDLLGIDSSGSRILAWSKHSVYSIMLVDGRPHRVLLKSFDFEIGRVFDYERDSKSCLAVLKSGTGELLLHDSNMENYSGVLSCEDSKAVSNEYVVECSEGEACVYDVELEKYICEIPIKSEAVAGADCVIRGSTIFVSAAEADGTRIYRIEDGKVTSEIVFKGIAERFVRTVEWYREALGTKFVNLMSRA